MELILLVEIPAKLGFGMKNYHFQEELFVRREDLTRPCLEELTNIGVDVSIGSINNAQSVQMIWNDL